MLERWFPPHTTWYNLHTTGNLLTSMPLWFFLYVVSRLVHFFGGPTLRYHKISYSSIFNPAHLQSTNYTVLQRSFTSRRLIEPTVSMETHTPYIVLHRLPRDVGRRDSVDEAMCPQHNAWTDPMWAVQLPLCAWRGPPESVPSSSWWSLSLSLIGGFGDI